MTVPDGTLTALKEKGIDKQEYLFELSKDELDSVFESLRKGPGKVVNNKVVAVAPQVILAKSRKPIAVAEEEMQYYAQVGRDITPTNMHWKTLTNFDIQWNALKYLKKQDDSDVPKLTKNNSIIK